MRGLIEFLVVIDSEHSSRCCRRCSGSADLRGEEPGSHTGKHHEGGESVEIRHTYPAGKSRDFGVVPRDWEENRRVAQNAEIVPIVGVFPDVLTGEDNIPPEGLLHPSVELIAPAWGNRVSAGRGTPQQRI